MPKACVFSHRALFFEGELNGDILKDIRLVELIKIGDSWKVDEVSVN